MAYGLTGAAKSAAQKVASNLKKKTGGGSTPTNNQGTNANLGNTWDANTDYSDIISKSVASGDYVTAAKAEQLRNQKIKDTNSSYSPTNKYSGWLDNTDYSTIGMNQMANGASWQDVLNTYNSRYNKANETEGLQQYANDELQNMMLNYINSQKSIEEYQKWQEEYEQNNERPTQPERDPRIDALLNEILNREDFSYDVMNDPLYQQYAQMYQREGDRAMKETMAEAAASAGGMNTYAITAAQQANSYYGSQLNDKIPQLYQLAYDMYLNDKESKVQDLGILQNMDATQYNRYRDTMNDWRNDRNFAYGTYQNGVQQGNWLTNSNYNAMWDNKTFNTEQGWKNKEWDYNDYWTNKQWETGREDVEYDRNQSEKDQAKEDVKWWISQGIMPDTELIKASGLDEASVKLAVDQIKAEMARKGISSGGGSSRSSSSSKGGGGGDDEIEPIVNQEDDIEPIVNQEEVKDVSNSQVLGLGIGPINNETLEKLVLAGAVVVKNDGTAQWANGYNKNNYQEALDKIHTQNSYPSLLWGI